MKYIVLRKWIAGLLFFVSIEMTSAQIIRVGAKAGPQLSWFAVDDPKYNTVATVRPTVGFHAGLVLAFKVKDRYFLNTELLYSQKGKNAVGKIDPNLNDKVVYQHIDIPVLFSMHFKGKLAKTRQFKWYVNAGPTTSYWLGGKGVIESGDLIENGLSQLKYKIAFGTRPDHNNPDILYLKDVKRLQFGMSIGGGLLLEPANKQKVMIDFRYEIGHTRIGTPESSQFMVPADYQDSLKGRNKGIRLSLVYLFEFTSDHKERNKGKSTANTKG
ncbi:MAG TPA: porin family protein [Chryseolinea sp.]|nr:porin family protein [Chryseolinea sp.]